MAGGMGSSGPFEESYAALGDLLASERRRNEAGIASLTALVAGIGTGVTFDEPGSSARARDQYEAAPQRPPPVQYPILPTRTTHGGPFGASIIERVMASVTKGNEW